MNCLTRAARLVFAMFACAASATSYEDVIESTPLLEGAETCSYTIASTGGEARLEERFSPGTGEDGWVLVAVNSEAPSKGDFRAYRKRREQRSRRNHPLTFDPKKIPKPGTIEMTDEDPETVTFTFAMQPTEDDENARITEQLTGTMVFSKTERRPLTLVVHNEAPLSAGPGVKMTEFRQSFRFRNHPIFEVPFAEEVQFHMRGKAFVFKTIEVDRTLKFRAFDCTNTDDEFPIT